MTFTFASTDIKSIMFRPKYYIKYKIYTIWIFYLNMIWILMKLFQILIILGNTLYCYVLIKSGSHF